MEVWITKQDDTPAQGRVWPPDDVYFADFSKNSTREWWKLLIKKFHDEELEFAALWIVSANIFQSIYLHKCAFCRHCEL